MRDLELALSSSPLCRSRLLPHQLGLRCSSFFLISFCLISFASPAEPPMLILLIECQFPQALSPSSRAKRGVLWYTKTLCDIFFKYCKKSYTVNDWASLCCSQVISTVCMDSIGYAFGLLDTVQGEWSRLRELLPFVYCSFHSNSASGPFRIHSSFYFIFESKCFFSLFLICCISLFSFLPSIYCNLFQESLCVLFLLSSLPTYSLFFHLIHLFCLWLHGMVRSK